ncbi:MAG: class I SAM-dependent methyltransferase [Chloroflexota bacterium]|nr:class I SAM-dependent methyltransferase [Chloroflexota bacterium]
MSALDPYADDELAELYDLDHAGYDDDLALYEQFARRAATPVLELGVGSGRVARYLAAHGHRVVGIDSSPAMLRRLAASLDGELEPRVRLVETDMRSIVLGEHFELIYCALNTFEHLLSSEDQFAALRCVAAHLARGGVFVFQIRALTSIEWTEPRSPLQLQWLRPHPASGDMVAKTSSTSVAPARQLITNTIIFDRTAGDGTVHRRMLEVMLRLTGRFEMELLLRQAGLRLSTLYGDCDLSPFDDDSDTMIVVAELEGD